MKFTTRKAMHWSRLPTEVMPSPSLEFLTALLDKALSSLVRSYSCPFCALEVGLWDLLRSLLPQVVLWFCHRALQSSQPDSVHQHTLPHFGVLQCFWHMSDSPWEIFLSLIHHCHDYLCMHLGEINPVSGEMSSSQLRVWISDGR